MGTGPRPVGKMDNAKKRWNKDGTLWIPDIGQERRIRVAAIRDELELEEQARSHGRMDQPPASDTTLNEPQLEVCSRIFSGILMLNQFLAEQLGGALARGRQSMPTAIDGADYKARIDIAVTDVFAEQTGQIQRLRQNDLSLQKDLRYFRNKHKLNRQADYRESILLVIGFIMAMMVVESFFNGLLFKDVVSGGLATGAFIALAISALNIALGLVAGLYGWRNLSHVEGRRKLIGGVITSVCHGAAIFWNLAIAQFRDVAEQAAANPNYDFNFGGLTSATVQHIHDHGLVSFRSVIAWALLILGLIVHFLAAKEGWDDLADRYPDYKKIDQRARLARQDFDSALVGLRSAARQAAATVVAEAEQEDQGGKAKAHAIATLDDLARQREKEVRDSEDEWVAGGTQLLKTYRDINVEVRGGDEAPAYFDRYPEAADYRNRRYDKTPDSPVDLDHYLIVTKQSIDQIASLKASADHTVANNAETLRKLSAEINVALAQLDKKVAGAKAKATSEAMSAMREMSTTG